MGHHVAAKELKDVEEIYEYIGDSKKLLHFSKGVCLKTSSDIFIKMSRTQVVSHVTISCGGERWQWWWRGVARNGGGG